MPLTREDRFVNSDGNRPLQLTRAYSGDYPYGPRFSKRTHALATAPDASKIVTTRVPRPRYAEKSAEAYFDKFENVDPRVTTLFVNIFPTEFIDQSEDFRLACVSAGLALSRRINNAEIPDEMFPPITQKQFELAHDICNMVFLAHRNNDKESGESFRLDGHSLPEYIGIVNSQVKSFLSETSQDLSNVEPVNPDTIMDALNAYSKASTQVTSIIT